ncbi:MAG: TAXI family TRAP transporter solute-binding subunit [Candidatus Magasanikbacteria bacterium]|nr:TAXI family TRAP transporter solute-binding subunit [Candidatus Magasanikbacteria bacterium]
MCGAAFAEKSTITIGAGSAGGTYFTVVKEITRFCSSPTLEIKHYIKSDGKTIEGGSIKNLENLLNNEMQCGIVQRDIAQLAKMNDPENMSRIIALVPLHQEQVHFLTLNYVSAKQASSRFTKLIGNEKTVYIENPMTSISHLQGKAVAAWGGSVKTAEIIKLMTNINFRIVDVADEKEALQKINNGEVACIIAVVGAPAPWIKVLPKKQFKLLSAKEEADRLKDFYSISTIKYDNLGSTGQTVKTFNTDCILFTREYRSPQTIKALTELQMNIRKNIYLIRDTPHTHPAWQKVDPSRPAKWDKNFNGK